MQADIQMMLHEAKSGRVYGTHQASAPGESPAADSGALEQSIEIEQTSETEQAVYSDSPYAPALEYGRTDGHIAPRPMWTPAAESAQERLEQELSRLE